MPGYKSFTKKVREGLVVKVDEMRRRGYTLKKIVMSLGVSRGTVDHIIRRLTRCGGFEKIKKAAEQIANQHGWVGALIEKNGCHVRRYCDYTFTDDVSPREQTIIAMKKNSCTFAEIGRALSLTRERVRQIAEAILEIYGPKIFLPEVKTFWTCNEVAKISGVTPYYIRRLCEAGKISSKCTEGGRIRYLITKKGIEELSLLTRKQSACIICGSFVEWAGKKPRRICVGGNCKKEYRRRRTAEYLSNRNAIIKSLRGWRKALWQALQNRIVTENETWVMLCEAVKTSGLKKVQITYLRMCGLISTCPTSKKHCLGGVVNLYSFNEMQIARQIASKFGLL